MRDEREAAESIVRVIADLEDALDRIEVLERRVIRLTVSTDLMTDRIKAVESAQATARPLMVDVEDVGYVRASGPWGANLDAIREIPARRQRQVLLLPEIWSPEGVTARQIVESLSERYPAQPMNTPNVYPLLKKMVELELVDELPDTSPVRFVVSRRMFPV